MSKPGLHDALLRRLGDDLVTGELAAGTVLTMEQIEDRYGVSRTVVREVIKVLQSLGVVTSRRRVGITVQPEHAWEALSPVIVQWRLDGPRRLDHLREISELRRGIEPVAAALAAQRASRDQIERLRAAVTGMSVTGPAGDLTAYLAHDVDFHQCLLEASGNPMLASLTGLVKEALTGRTTHDLMPATPEPQAIAWHVEIAAAVGAGDAVRAEEAARLIVEEARSAVEDLR
ncbi:FadR/GntR family transcriptional regulator [Janibacter sp. GXQ6167]|uniref:FadR/GntR family transcriptional regulator n=1 Tax=Janibacter sp. GXQ6167 TaxID=3240791 RepID=UPI0035256303